MKSMSGTFLVFCAVAMTLALTGCGGGSSSSAGSVSQGAFKNHYAVTEDSYGVQNATFLSAYRAGTSLTMRAAIASSLTDPNFRSIFRIDITEPEKITGPGAYYIGEQPFGIPKFPGEILLFNGHESTLLRTVSGTVIFTSYGTQTGDHVAGSFEIVVEDRHSTKTPWPTYTIKANFGYVVNSSSRIVPAPTPVPAAAAAVYDGKCSSCHLLGSYDTAGSASDLSLRGGEIAYMFTAGAAHHQNITLSGQELLDLKIFLNAN